ncbi:MAG: sucrase ferredoxin [Pseudomonadales bacterium]
MPNQIYCSESAAREPMIGTAEQVDVWVMLEYRPTWKPRALQQNALAPETRAWLEASVMALAQAGWKPRPQFIRQPEIDSETVRLLIAVAGRLLVFSGRGYDFLRDLDLTAVVAEPHGHEAVAQPQYFVCTNGQRDLCCARFGLPAYAALRALVGDRAWQITHLGGHRFAPNVLVLPQGAMYGRVNTTTEVDQLVRVVDGGGLCFPYLRGRSGYPPAVQAAEALSGRSDLRLVGVEGDDSRARVTFEGADGRFSVAVRRAAEPISVLKSCGDESSKPVYPYVPD